jgi:hypothetical protein
LVMRYWLGSWGGCPVCSGAMHLQRSVEMLGGVLAYLWLSGTSVVGSFGLEFLSSEL